MRSFSLLLSCGLLAVAGVAVWPSRPATTSELVVTPQFCTGSAAAESAWAKALFEFARQTDDPASQARARSAALEALAVAPRRAVVFASLGLLGGGPWAAFASEADLRLELDRRTGRLSPALAAQAAARTPTDPLTVALLEALEPQLIRWRDGDESAAAAAQQLLRGDDCRRVCLEAAVALDPHCTPAWQALALEGDAARRQAAVEQFCDLAPDNAAPCYLAAAVALDVGDRHAALAALRRGHARPECRWAELPLPQDFQVVLPDDPALGRAAGRPLTSALLANLVWLSARSRAAAPPAEHLQRLAESLALTADVPPPAADLGPTLHTLGTRLIAGPTAADVRHGLAILQLGAGLRQAVDEQAALSRYDFHLQRSTRELSQGLTAWTARLDALLADHDAILSGGIDLPGEEAAAMQRLTTQPRLQAGLASESSPR